MHSQLEFFPVFFSVTMFKSRYVTYTDDNNSGQVE